MHPSAASDPDNLKGPGDMTITIADDVVELRAKALELGAALIRLHLPDARVGVWQAMGGLRVSLGVLGEPAQQIREHRQQWQNALGLEDPIRIDHINSDGYDLVSTGTHDG